MHGTQTTPRRNRHAARAAAGLLVLVAGGCQSPNEAERATLQRSVIDSIRREMIEAERTPDYRLTDRTSTVETLEIPDDRMAELNELSGPQSYLGVENRLDRDLLGDEQRSVNVSLEL